MGLFDDKIRNQISGILAGVKDPVSVSFFTQEFECRSCADAHSFVEEVSSLNRQIQLSVYDFVRDRAKADELGIDKVPAIALRDAGGRGLGVTFFGTPGGYEINSFLGTLIEASGKREPLPPAVASRVAAINRDVHLQVFVSLTCPYCPGAVSLAHRLALESGRVRADMVDAQLFPHLAQKYQVSGVPRIVINESHSLVGVQTAEKLLDVIEKL
jgi:glutaredoxin-like protein